MDEFDPNRRRFVGYAVPVSSPDTQSRRRVLRTLTTRFTGGVSMRVHEMNVGHKQAAEDYICALVEVGAIPYRERYEVRYPRGI